MTGISWHLSCLAKFLRYSFFHELKQPILLDNSWRESLSEPYLPPTILISPWCVATCKCTAVGEERMHGAFALRWIFTEDGCLFCFFLQETVWRMKVSHFSLSLFSPLSSTSSLFSQYFRVTKLLGCSEGGWGFLAGLLMITALRRVKALSQTTRGGNEGLRRDWWVTSFRYGITHLLFRLHSWSLHGGHRSSSSSLSSREEVEESHSSSSAATGVVALGSGVAFRAGVACRSV